jgi:hypothetical protein
MQDNEPKRPNPGEDGRLDTPDKLVQWARDVDAGRQQEPRCIARMRLSKYTLAAVCDDCSVGWIFERPIPGGMECRVIGGYDPHETDTPLKLLRIVEHWCEDPDAYPDGADPKGIASFIRAICELRGWADPGPAPI